MPTKSVFFRKDDLPLWENIQDKSEWLHQHLRNDVTQPTTKTRPLNEVIEDDDEDEYDTTGMVYNVTIDKVQDATTGEWLPQDNTLVATLKRQGKVVH